MRRAFLGLGLAAGLVGGLLACQAPSVPAPASAGSAAQPAVTQPLRVRVSTGAAAWLVRTVGAGAGVEVAGVAPVEASLTQWQPDAAAVAELLRADLLVFNGAGLEAFATTVSLPGSRVLDLAAPQRARWLYLPEVLRHSHGPGGAHTHQGADPHLWLDPDGLRAQARAIHGALLQRRPDARAALAGGLASALAQVDEWQGELTLATEALAGRGLLCNHPGFAYLARGQGWDLRRVDLAAEEASVRAALAEGPAPVMLAVRPLGEETETRLRAGLGIEVVVFPTGEAVPVRPSDDLEPMRSWRAATVRLTALLAGSDGPPPARPEVPAALP